MLLLYPSHRLVESAEVIFGDQAIVFTPMLLPGARKQVMAAVVEDTEDVREVADTYSALLTLQESPLPRPMRRVEAAPVASPLALRVQVAALKVAAEPDRVVELIHDQVRTRVLARDGERSPDLAHVRILARGWRVEDLVGLPGGDDLSPSAGRSVSTGLGAMEMMATSPPERWDELSAHYYPWEVSGWAPPDNEWRAAGVPAKPPAETEPQTKAEVDVTPREDVITDGGAAVVVAGPPDIGPEHPAVGVYGSLEQVRAARTIAWKLLGPDGLNGPKPPFKKLAAQLKANYDLALPELGTGHMNLLYTP